MREGVVKEERDEHAHILVDTDTGYDAPKAVSVTSPRSNRIRLGDPGNGNGMYNSLLVASFPGPPSPAPVWQGWEGGT